MNKEKKSFLTELQWAINPDTVFMPFYQNLFFIILSPALECKLSIENKVMVTYFFSYYVACNLVKKYMLKWFHFK